MNRKIHARTNKFLRKLLVRGKVWKTRRTIKKVASFYPQYLTPLPRELENKYLDLWSPLYKPVELTYLRFFSNYSSIYDYRYVPQDLYTAIILRIMNDINRARTDADKNFLDQTIGKDMTPGIYLRNIRGSYSNKEFVVVPRHEANQIFKQIEANIIVKPSIRSGQGKNVRLFRFRDNKFLDHQGNQIDLPWLESVYKKDFVIQEQVPQHSALAELNESTLNTFRVCSYRSVMTEKPVILGVFLKIGKSGEVADNLYKGGICVIVDENGSLNDYGTDVMYQKITELPNLQVPFKYTRIPHINKIRNLGLRIATLLPAHRLLQMDIALKDDNEACLIDLNLTNSGLLQVMGGPHFAGYTEEIVDYCINNRHEDHFEVITT